MVDDTGLRRKLAQVPARVESAVRAQMAKYAAQLVAEMKMLVPVDTGELRTSIGWTWGKAPEGSLSIAIVGAQATPGIFLTVYAGNEKTMVSNSRGQLFQNARLQEFGTKNMPANPFFYVAWRANRRRIRSGLTRAVRKAVKTTH